MWQNKFTGILGIWIFVLAFLGFSDSLHRFLLVLTGIFMILVGFWGKRLIKSTEELIEEPKEKEAERSLEETMEPNKTKDSEGKEEEEDKKQIQINAQ